MGDGRGVQGGSGHVANSLMEKYGTVQLADTGQVRAGLWIKGWEGWVRDISFQGIFST